MPHPEPDPEPVIDLGAFDRRFRRALIAFFTRRTGDHAEAEDMTQEVFVRLARGGGQDMRSADAYVFQVAANLVRDRGRKLAVRQDGADIVRAADQARGEPLDAERILIGKDNLQAVVAVLRDLNPKTRDILLLNRLDGLSHNELARMFGISTSMVGKHIYKASALLAARLGDANE